MSVSQKFAVLLERINRIQGEINGLQRDDDVVIYKNSNFDIEISAKRSSVVYITTGSVSAVKLPSRNVPDNFKIKIVSRSDSPILISASHMMHNQTYAPTEGLQFFYLESNRMIDLAFYAGAWNFLI